VRHTPRLQRVVDVDLRALLAGQGKEIVEETRFPAMGAGGCCEGLVAENGSRAGSEPRQAQKLAPPNNAR
jgi:hypothetical protein